MKRKQRKDIFEAIGILAIVASLVFLAFEIQQNTAAVKRESQQAIHDQVAVVFGWLLGDTFASLFWQGMAEPDSLSDVQALQFESFWTAAFNAYQNIYFQTRSGAFDATLADGWWQQMRNYLEFPGMQRYWEKRNYVFAPEFREFVENQVMSREVTPKFDPRL
jgi:hypothetical protein